MLLSFLSAGCSFFMLRATSNATTPATLVDYFYSTTKLNKSRLCSCAFGAAAAVLLC